MSKKKVIQAGICVVLLGAAVSGTAIAEENQEYDSNVPEVVISAKYEYQYDEAREQTIGNLDWQEIHLSEKSTEDYPEMSKSLQKFNDNLSADRKETFDSMLELYESADEYFPENGLSSSDSILLRRADGQVLSFVDYHTDYMGGAHGYYSYTGTSFDAASGKILSLEDVVTDEGSFQEAVKEQLLKHPYSDEFQDLDESLTSYGTEEGDLFSWVLEEDGITVFFNPYAIASYAVGMIHVNISFREYPDLFRDTYKIPEGNYMKELMQYYPEYITLADGEIAQVSISSETEAYEGEEGGYTDYGYYTAYNVTIGDNTLRHDSYFFWEKPFLVHLTDNRTYLYLQLTGDNDYRMVDVVDLSSGNPTFIGSFGGGFGWSYDEEQEASLGILPVDTQHFRLDTKIDLLSSYTGIRYYQVGEDGMPEALEEEYYKDNNYYSRPLVTKIDLDATLPEDNFLPVTIPAGETLDIIKTDGESYVDLRQKDGTLVRLEVNGSGWPHTVNGIDEADCFEELYYAG